MAPASVQPPSSDELTMVTRLFEWVSQWGYFLTPSAIAVALGFVWRTSWRMAQFEAIQKQHSDEIAEAKRLRIEYEAAAETLATKADLQAAQEAITGEMRANLANMTQLIIGRR